MEGQIEKLLLEIEEVEVDEENLKLQALIIAKEEEIVQLNKKVDTANRLNKLLKLPEINLDE